MFVIGLLIAVTVLNESAHRYRFTGDPHRLDRDGDGVACESLP